jgi:hypothetical protein
MPCAPYVCMYVCMYVRMYVCMSWALNSVLLNACVFSDVISVTTKLTQGGMPGGGQREGLFAAADCPPLCIV